MPAWTSWTPLIITLWLITLLAWMLVSPSIREAASQVRTWWRSNGLPARSIVIIAIAFSASIGGSKGPSPVTKLLRLLFWDHALTWPLTTAQQHTQAAVAANDSTASVMDVIDAVTNPVCTLSFDWHVPDRLPYHARQNVMAWTAAVIPTNIAGTLFEDHYISFNSTASTNPAVILIEYAGRAEDGTVFRQSAAVVTNSFPFTSVIHLQSGSHTCYWFRCAVPVAFTNSVRDWNGEALFGSPVGSGRGFDLLGTLIVDDGDHIWVGATTNIVLGGITNLFKNGINITEKAQ